MTDTDNKYYKHITSEHRLFDLNLKELWRYRELVTLLTKRSFQVRYRQTIGGWLWLIIVPLFHTFVSYLTFGGIAKLGTDGIPPVIFYLSGTALWTFFTSCINKNANVFRTNAPVFQKVYFPRLAVCISYVFSDLIELLINMGLVAIIIISYIFFGNIQINYKTLIIAPFLIIQIGMMGLGVGIIASSLTTKYRDFSYALGFLTALWMPITPVMYPMSEISNPLIRTCFMINPLTGTMELFRYSVFGKGEILWGNIIWGVIFTVCVVFIGIIMFKKVERTFSDTI